MPTTPTAYFASLRAELVVIEKRARPIYEGGQQVDTTPGVYHAFSDHRATIEGQKSIEFIRERIANGLDAWEISAYDALPVVDILTELTTATLERVYEIMTEEQDGPNRPEIVNVCAGILEKYAEAKAEDEAAATAST